MRKVGELERFELRVYNAVKKLSGEKAENGSAKKATRSEVGRLLRIEKDPYYFKTRTALVRLAHEGLLKLHGEKRNSYYTIAKWD